MKDAYLRVREFVGNLWGAITTQTLVILVGVQPLLAELDPSLLTPKLRWAIFGISVVTLILRASAPPVKSVTINIDDEVVTDPETGVVTIAKADGAVPAGVVDKPAGITARAAERLANITIAEARTQEKV